MKERPILFSGPMMRANLLGLKTQTRRALKHPEHYGCPTGDCPHSTQLECDRAMNAAEVLAKCPYGVPGDRLWARETWQQVVPAGGNQWMTVGTPDEHREGARLVYAATVADGEHPSRWRSSLHMPRWASRFTPTVVEVRVQRLQEISEEDAIAEGVTAPESRLDAQSLMARGLPMNACGAYARLWDAINGDGAWALNPWVWAVTYRPKWDQVHPAIVDVEKGIAASRSLMR